MNKKGLFITFPICALMILSACGGNAGSSTQSSVKPSEVPSSQESKSAEPSKAEQSSEKVKAAFKVRMNNEGAEVKFEHEQSSYYVGDLVRFALELKEGFTLKEISWNNKDLDYDEFEDYPYSFTAASSNNIKVTLNTDIKVTGKITFDGVDLTEEEADSIGIRVVDANEKYIQGTIAYNEGSANYTIKNIANDTDYTIEILGYPNSEKTSPFVYSTAKLSVEAESVVKNIDVNAKKVLNDVEYGAKLPSEEGATAKLFAVEHKGAGYLINDFTVEIKLSTHLSDFTAEGVQSVSNVFQLSGMAEGISTANPGFTQFRIMFQDVKGGFPVEKRAYTLQKCGDGWTSFDLEDYFLQADIENEENDIAVLISFGMDEYKAYFAVNGKYVECLTFSSSWRLFPKYIDSGVWSDKCLNNTSIKSLKMYGSCPNPGSIEGYTELTEKLPK